MFPTTSELSRMSSRTVGTKNGSKYLINLEMDGDPVVRTSVGLTRTWKAIKRFQ